MFFWGLHPNGKFDVATIRYAVEGDISAITKELVSLVEAEVIEKEVENGVAYYYLTLNEAKRKSIIEWAGPGHTGR
jgi:predicted transcriptional regulator